MSDPSVASERAAANPIRVDLRLLADVEALLEKFDEAELD
jgi:hypothetical protein